MSHKLFISLTMVLIITACAPATPAPAPTPTPVPATPAPLDEKVDVGGYKLRIICTGQGTPIVIVDAGYAEPAVESGNWLNVRYGVEKTTRICVYDRAGLGWSGVARTQARTSQDMVEDLHTLLVNANVPGPYILVGHLFGGFNVRLYASQYPDEVVGMVLVDSDHPDYEPETLAVLPPESPGEPDILKSMRTYGLYPDPSYNPERLDFIASAAQVRAADPLGDLPLVVLTRSPNPASGCCVDPTLPPDISAKMVQVWQDLQIDLTGLSSNSTHIVATKAGPFIQVEEPQLVIDAILKVIDEAKK